METWLAFWFINVVPSFTVFGFSTFTRVAPLARWTRSLGIEKHGASKMKTWSVEYKDHRIDVKNGWLAGEQLIVDGELQDLRAGLAMRSRLYGQIKSGDGQGEQIKISLGGWWTVKCHIFIGDNHVFSG